MNKLAEFVNEKLKEKYVQTSVKVEIETPYGVRVTVGLEPDYEGAWDMIANDFGDFDSQPKGDVWCDRKYKCVVTHGDRWPQPPEGWVEAYSWRDVSPIKDVQKESGLSLDWFENNNIPEELGWWDNEADENDLDAFDNWIKRLNQWANAHTIEGDKVITPECYVRYYDEARDCRYFNLVNSGLSEAEYAAADWKMAERFNDQQWGYYIPEVKVYVQGQEVFSQCGWDVQMGDWTSKEEQEWVRESVGEVLDEFDAAAIARELNRTMQQLEVAIQVMEADDAQDY